MVKLGWPSFVPILGTSAGKLQTELRSVFLGFLIFLFVFSVGHWLLVIGHCFRWGGGIGIRACLRGMSRKRCGFKSRPQQFILPSKINKVPMNSGRSPFNFLISS
jgi:hypothetical protein